MHELTDYLQWDIYRISFHLAKLPTSKVMIMVIILGLQTLILQSKLLIQISRLIAHLVVVYHDKGITPKIWTDEKREKHQEMNTEISNNYSKSFIQIRITLFPVLLSLQFFFCSDSHLFWKLIHLQLSFKFGVRFGWLKICVNLRVNPNETMILLWLYCEPWVVTWQMEIS